VKLNAAEETWVGENERVGGGVEDEVVVLARGMGRRRNRKVAGHAEMDAEPRVDRGGGGQGGRGGTLKAEKDLLRGGGGGGENGVG
jgi:hypothetical protein